MYKIAGIFEISDFLLVWNLNFVANWLLFRQKFTPLLFNSINRVYVL